MMPARDISPHVPCPRRAPAAGRSGALRPADRAPPCSVPWAVAAPASSARPPRTERRDPPPIRRISAIRRRRVAYRTEGRRVGWSRAGGGRGAVAGPRTVASRPRGRFLKVPSRCHARCEHATSRILGAKQDLPLLAYVALGPSATHCSKWPHQVCTT